MTVRRERKVAELAGAFGDSREHGVAMRNGFVSGRRHAPRNCFCRINCFFAQGCSLGDFQSCFPESFVFVQILARARVSFLAATVPRDSLEKCTSLQTR